MSSYPVDDPDKTVIKTKVTLTEEARVTTPEGVLSSEAKAEFAEIGREINKLSQGIFHSLEGFRTFILRGNVIDLAIGIVIGAAFTSVVNALVSDLITPLIPVSKDSNLSTYVVQFSYVTLHVGAFINAVISFLIVAAVLYFFVVQPVNAMMKLYRPKDVEAKAMRDCPYCFQSVHIHAVRCPYCTSHLVEEHKHKDEEPVLELPASLEGLSNKLAEQIVRKATSQLEKAASASAESTSAPAQE